MLKLTKIIASSVIFASVLALNPSGASAEWRQASYNRWWYSEGNSWATGWRNIDRKWYYFDKDSYMAKGFRTLNGKTYFFGLDGYMKTGWIENYGFWYYFYPSGEKAINTVIDGCELDEDGIWVKPSQEAENARNLIFKEDSNYINSMYNKGYKLSRHYKEGDTYNFISHVWMVPAEDVYEFTFSDEGGAYIVGKKSNNVYCITGDAGFQIYQIKNNQKVKTYLSSLSPYRADWR